MSETRREGEEVVETWLRGWLTDCGRTGRGHISEAILPHLAARLAADRDAAGVEALSGDGVEELVARAIYAVDQPDYPTLFGVRDTGEARRIDDRVRTHAAAALGALRAALSGPASAEEDERE